MATNINNGETGLSARTKINNAFAEINTNVSDIAQLEIDLTAAESLLQGNINTVSGSLTTHVANTSNPHSVTKAQVGLSNVDNTSDANKPISILTQGALDSKQDIGAAAYTTASIVGDHIIASTDSQKIITMITAAPATLTIDAGTGFPAGSQFIIINDPSSTDPISVLGSATVSYNGTLTNSIDAGASAWFICVAVNEFFRVT